MDVQTRNDRPRAYSVKSFCKAYDVSRSFTYNCFADGRLRSVKIAGRRLIPADAAERTLRLVDAYEGREFKRERVYVALTNGRRRAAWTYVLRRQPPRSARQLQGGRYASRRGVA